jgi:hypothetical protein
MEHLIPEEIVMNQIMVACQTMGKWLPVSINGQALKYGMTQTVNCPCGHEQFVIGMRKRIVGENDSQETKKSL